MAWAAVVATSDVVEHEQRTHWVQMNPASSPVVAAAAVAVPQTIVELVSLELAPLPLTCCAATFLHVY